MPDATMAWPDAIPVRLRAALTRAAAGLPANVALMHLLMECAAPADAEASLSAGIASRAAAGDAEGAGRLRAVLEALHANPQAFAIVRDTLAGLDHARPPQESAEAVAYWATAFDGAARRSPEGSVALYALGNPELLAAATHEIADRLDGWGLLRPTARCLDIGCGIGRLELALAGRLAGIVGIDIAPAMTAQARRRTAALANVEIRETGGRDLADFAGASFDLVLAVDCFPYLHQAGGDLVTTMCNEIGRVLRPGGSAVILNFSYRGDLQRDRNELAALAGPAGLALARFADADFTLWDAATFILERP